LFARLKGCFGHKSEDCCNTCDTCGGGHKHHKSNDCGCNDGCGGGHGLFSRFKGHKHNDCCNTCDTGCGSSGYGSGGGYGGGGCGSTIIPPGHPTGAPPVTTPMAPATGEPIKPPKEGEPAQKLPTGNKETAVPINPPANINLNSPTEKVDGDAKNPF